MFTCMCRCTFVLHCRYPAAVYRPDKMSRPATRVPSRDDVGTTRLLSPKSRSRIWVVSKTWEDVEADLTEAQIRETTVISLTVFTRTSLARHSFHLQPLHPHSLHLQDGDPPNFHRHNVDPPTTFTNSCFTNPHFHLQPLHSLTALTQNMSTHPQLSPTPHWPTPVAFTQAAHPSTALIHSCFTHSQSSSTAASPTDIFHPHQVKPLTDFTHTWLSHPQPSVHVHLVNSSTAFSLPTPGCLTQPSPTPGWLTHIIHPHLVDLTTASPIPGWPTHSFTPTSIRIWLGCFMVYTNNGVVCGLAINNLVVYGLDK